MSESVRPEVKRYRPEVVHGSDFSMAAIGYCEDEYGPVVLASDYDALQQRYDELRGLADALFTALSRSRGHACYLDLPHLRDECDQALHAMARFRSGSAGPSGTDQPDQ